MCKLTWSRMVSGVYLSFQWSTKTKSRVSTSYFFFSWGIISSEGPSMSVTWKANLPDELWAKEESHMPLAYFKSWQDISDPSIVTYSLSWSDTFGSCGLFFFEESIHMCSKIFFFSITIKKKKKVVCCFCWIMIFSGNKGIFCWKQNFYYFCSCTSV